MMRSRIRRDDGQVSLAVVAFALVVLVIGIGFMIFGQASDVRGKAQKAADAAALAAAKDVRDEWIPAWATSQIPPVTAAPLPVNPPFDAVFWYPNVSSAGAGGARDYAAQNDNATVDSYRVTGYGTIKVDTSSQREDVKGTSGRIIDDVQAPGSATAEVRPSPGTSCVQNTIIYSPQTGVTSWAITCTGAATATVRYTGPTAAFPTYEGGMDSFRRLFEIRLVD